jgi:O-antigen ligase/tetratricopeptide (TPR) repeat protein
MVAERTRAPKVVVWAFIALGLAYLFFIGGAPAGVQIPLLRVASLGLAAGSFTFWAWVARRDPRWRPRSRFWPAIIAVVAALAVTTAFSRSPRVSVEYLAYAMVLAGLYLLLVRLLADPFFSSRIVAIASFTGMAIGAAFLVAVEVNWLEFWSAVGHFTTPPLRPDSESLIFGNPSPIGARVALLTAVALGWWSTITPRRGAIAAAISILAGVAILLTGTRGAWLGVFVGLTLVVMLVAYRSRSTGFRRSTERLAGLALRRHRSVWAVGISAGVSLVALGPAILARVGEGGDPVRETFGRIAVRMFADSPVVGVGPGMWPVLRLPFTDSSEVDFYAAHAHNLYLQTLAESGLVGAAAGVVVLSGILGLIRDGLADADANRRRWALVAVFACGYFATHQLTDFFGSRPAILLCFAIPLAMLDATATRLPAVPGSPVEWSPSGPVQMGMIAALVAALSFSIWAEVPAESHQTAVLRANGAAWAGADEPAAKAATMDPGMPIYHLTAGLTAVRVGDEERAAAEFSAAAEATDLPEAWLDLSNTQLTLGHPMDARASLQRALRLGVQRGAVAIAAAQVAMKLGDRELAIALAATAVTLLPSLAGDPSWRLIPEWVDLHEGVVIRAIATAKADVAWDIALMDGGRTRAEELTLPLGSAARAEALDVIAAWSFDHGAARRLFDRCEASPLDGPIRWCTRLSARLGNVEEAERYRRWGKTLGLSDQRLMEIRMVMGGTDPSTAGNPADSYGTVYRRWSTWDPIVPDLVHLTLE